MQESNIKIMNVLNRTNVQHYCRTCLIYLDPDEKIGWLEERYHLKTTKDLAVWIENSTSLPVLQTNENYPQFVCRGCYIILKDFNKFHKLVWQAADKLNALLQMPLENRIAEETDCKTIPTSGKNSQTNDGFEMEIKIEEFERLNNPISNEPLNKNLAPELLCDINNEIDIKMEFESSDTMLINTNFNKTQGEDDNKVVTTESSKDETSNLHKKLKSSKYVNVSKYKNYTLLQHNYKCLECNYSCAHFSTYKVHLQQVHSEELNSKVYKNINKLKDTTVEENIDKLDMKKKFECTTCQLTFIKKSKLSYHINFVHKKIRPHACQYCHLCFSSSYNRNIHERVHTGEKPFACDICGRQFAHKSSLTGHKKTHKGKLTEEIFVNTVSEQSQNDSNKNTNIQDADLEKTRQEEQHANMDNMKKKIECNICHKNFTSAAIARTHIKHVHEKIRPFVCQYCHHPCSTEIYLKLHERIHTGEKPHACDICGRRFIRSKVMKMHRKKHNVPGNQQNDGLQNNNSIIKNNKNQKKQCAICKKLFSRKYLMQHMSYVHKGIRKPAKNVCQYCPLSFDSKGALRKHECIHTGEKLVACDICDRRFILRSDMNKHKKSHFKTPLKNVQTDSIKNINIQDSELKENSSSEIKCEIKNEFESLESENVLKEETLKTLTDDLKTSKKSKREKKSNKNIKEYKCVEDGCSFSDVSSLSKHMAEVHNQAMPSINRPVNEKKYPCCICQKPFKERIILANHMSAFHKESNPFPCQFCHLHFANKIQMRHHERSHTSLRPFKCDICNRRFTRLGDKTKHQRRHHVEKKEYADNLVVLSTPPTTETRNYPTQEEEKEFVEDTSFLETPSIDPIRNELTHQKVCALEEEQSIGITVLLDSPQNDPIRTEPTQDKTSILNEQISTSELRNATYEATTKIERSDFESSIKPSLIMIDTSQDSSNFTYNDEADIAISKTNINTSTLDEIVISSDDGADIPKEIHNLQQKLKTPTASVIAHTNNLEISKALMQSNETFEIIKKYKCTICNFTFPHSSTLNEHIQRVHSKVIPKSRGFECSHCNKNFIIFSNLNNHMRIEHKDLLEKVLPGNTLQSAKSECSMKSQSLDNAIETIKLTHNVDDYCSKAKIN